MSKLLCKKSKGGIEMRRAFFKFLTSVLYLCIIGGGIILVASIAGLFIIIPASFMFFMLNNIRISLAILLLVYALDIVDFIINNKKE